MNHLLSTMRIAVATALLASIAGHGQTAVTFHPGEDTSTTLAGAAAAPAPERFAPLLATTADVQAFWKLSTEVFDVPFPTARGIARTFLEQRLHIDGDEYVVAHFDTAENRANGKPDHVVPLTDALMEGFPDHARHTLFAELSDAVGGVMSGGSRSPGVVSAIWQATACHGAGECFAKLGRYLWSRTGPGYLYNTFFAPGNVVETVEEDMRALDVAFTVYRLGDRNGPADGNHPKLSDIVKAFKEDSLFSELPYVKQLNTALAVYALKTRDAWPVLARYEFVRQARKALALHVLTREQYERVMTAAAPHVPLDGPIALDTLRRNAQRTSTDIERFDINGYPSSNIVRFAGPGQSEILYVPGHRTPFMPFARRSALWQWVVEQARDPRTLDELLAHFSIYHTQDGTFWTGVKHALENLANGTWKADPSAIDHGDLRIYGDMFVDMREQTARRLRQDARMQAGTAWEAWRVTINRSATLLGPLGFVPPLAIPIQAGTGLVQFGTGIEQAIDGRTADTRRNGIQQALEAAVSNAPLGMAFHRLGTTGEAEPLYDLERTPTVVPPRRINGRIGYLLGPNDPPRLPPGLPRRLYQRADGSLAIWNATDETRLTLIQLPPQAVRRPDATFTVGNRLFVPWRGREGTRATPVVRDGAGYRLLLPDGGTGPLVEKQDDDTWRLATDERNQLSGSALAAGISDKVTAEPRVLQYAAQMLEQMGVHETRLAELALTGAHGKPGARLVMLAVGHGIVETLPARLRDPSASAWTEHEVRLVAPAIARFTRRRLAFYREDGQMDFVVMTDGNELASTQAPPDAVRLQRMNHGYLLLDQPQARSLPWFPSVFAAAAKATHPTSNRLQIPAPAQEAGFRNALADSIDARMTYIRLERMRRRWIDTQPMPDRVKDSLRNVSRLHHSLFDRRHALSAEEEKLIVDTARSLLPPWRDVTIEVRRRDSGETGTGRRGSEEALALFQSDEPAPRRLVIAVDIDARGRRTAYYRVDDEGNIVAPAATADPPSSIVDALLNTHDGELRRALGRGEGEWRRFAGDLLARTLDADNALLPQGLDHLLVTDPGLLAYARTWETDQWDVGGQRYIRLKHLDGRSQVVRTRLPDPLDGKCEILPPRLDDTTPSGRFLVQRDGAWYPTGRLREGFDLVDPTTLFASAATLFARLPPTVPWRQASIRQVLDGMPQPLTAFHAHFLDGTGFTEDEGLTLTTRHPTWSGPRHYATGIGLDGSGFLGAVVRPPRPPAGGVEPIARDASLPSASAGYPEQPAATSPVTYESLRHAEAPVSDFIAHDLGDHHIDALANARRLRGMLREDTSMALVVGTNEHFFVAILPVSAETLAFAGTTGPGTLIADLPPDTVIIDAMYGVTSTAADFPGRIRDVAREHEAVGGTMSYVGADGQPATGSPVAFTERLLSTPVRPNLWSPANDPISEFRYVDYMRYRYVHALPVRHVGLDWLVDRAARRDYLRYFAPPFDTLPLDEPALSGQPGNSPANLLAELALAALAAGTRP